MSLLKGLETPYVGAGTVEFLLPGPLDSPSTEIFFTELNPRIQVEHTVSEMTTGMDLVLAQLRICLLGETVLSLPPPEVSKGTAIQARINLHPSTTPGAVLKRYEEPTGAWVRVDSGLKTGMRISTDYDPLILKLIVWTDVEKVPELTPDEKRLNVVKPATTFEGARVKLLEALEALVVDGDGIVTNIGYLKQLLTVDEFKSGDARTGLLEEGGMDEVLWMLSGVEVGVENLGSEETEEPTGEVVSVKSNISGTVTSANLDPTRPIRKGQPLLTLTSMKMESYVVAPADGYVFEPTPGIGDEGRVVKVGDLVCSFRPEKLGVNVAIDEKPVETWEAEIEEIDLRRRLARGLGGPKAVAAQKAAGRLNLRERIDLLLDKDTFFEFGKTTGTPVRDAEGKIVDVVPGNFVLGTGEVAKRQVVVGGEDFTIQGGSPNLAGLRKSVYTETLALELFCPLIRMHEGGGGSVGGADNRRDQAQAANTYRSPPPAAYETPRFQSVAMCLTKVPVVSAAMGTVAGLPASRLAASHFTVMVANGNAQVLTAGPKVVERALGYSTTKQELGGPEMHDTSGVVDNFASSEEDAIKQIRAFLSYMPQNIYELPPVTQPGLDRTPAELAQLNILVPKSRRQTFDMRKALQLTFDRDSFFELGTVKFGQTQITGLARLQGHPVAVMANDCRILAGAMTVDGAQKVTRFIEMAHTFRLPLITFIDEPGFDIGLDAERAGTMRWGTKAVLTAQTAKIPWLVARSRLSLCAS
jgi:acetyl-CoA carboxylase carboxyltransferase component